MSQSMLAIKTKLGSSSNSLRAYAVARGLSVPDSMAEFDSWLNAAEAIDFTFTAGGVYKNEGTLSVTSATGGIGTKTWYLLIAGTYAGPYTINSGAVTGLANGIYTMKVVDTDANTPDKLKQHTFDLPRRVGTSMTLYWVLKSSYPSPTSTSGWSSGTIETNTSTLGTPAQIFAAASKFLIGSSISSLDNVNFWVSEGASYKEAFHPTSGTADAFFEVAQSQTLTSNTGTGTAFPTPTKYAFTRYNVDANCDDSNATEVWSYTNYSAGFYTIGGTKYRLATAVHTNYTMEITTATASSCSVASDCECYTIYNEDGARLITFQYYRCSDGNLTSLNVAAGASRNVCVQTGTDIESDDIELLTVVACGTPCDINTDCTTC